VFSTKPYDKQFLQAANMPPDVHELAFLEPRLTEETAPLAAGYNAVCAFVNDVLDAATLARLAPLGVRLIALRCAGFNHVDIQAAQRHGLCVVRVPAYSPHAVAEHTVGLILALNRKLHKAYARVREGNFSLDGLLGWDLHGQTAGVVGTGRIGCAVARILHGLGMRVLAHDLAPASELVALGVHYVPLAELLRESHIVTLHCPLVPETHHLVDERAVQQMRPGVMLINTSRGALIDTQAVIQGLKSGHIGSLGLDVYEEEADLFFEDLSNQVIQDDVFTRLLTFPNVLITAHQAFFTRNALESIARQTMRNLSCFERGEPFDPHVEVTPMRVRN
jgi:D-lactate dehydrogenase